MDRRLATATVLALVLGVGLMVPFEATVTRILGVASLLAFIVLGVFTLASPELLGEDPEERSRPS